MNECKVNVGCDGTSYWMGLALFPKGLAPPFGIKINPVWNTGEKLVFYKVGSQYIKVVPTLSSSIEDLIK